MSLVNRPRVSKYVAGSYIVLVIFIAAVIAFFVYAGLFTPMGNVGLIAAVVSIFVEAIMLLILTSIYRTRYTLTNEQLVIKATKLIGGNKRVHLKESTNVERTLMPFGLKLFGASFHGGYYYVPRLGRAYLTITNFSDGVLIKTKNENYITTPNTPESFIKTLNKVIDRLS
ncbi:MAG: PH domain-containing protein [Candidatus Bathyarchaeota archaeon]|nr:PH domain-containing protein [Candidatus Bathyarchaeota archaeon]